MLTPERLFSELGASIERGEGHMQALHRLRPDLDLERERTLLGGDGASSFQVADIYPDARPALERLHAMGYRIGAAGNMRAETESVLTLSGLPFSFVGSSERWDVDKPNLLFFEQVVRAAETPAELIAYVGDRIDNDIVPAKAAGMRSVFVRRGPWAEVQGNRPDASAADATIAGLADLPQVLKRWRSSPIDSARSDRLAR